MQDLKENISSTVKVCVPCGSLYVTIVKDEDKVKRIFVHRNSRFHCPTAIRDALSRQSTYQSKRDTGQLIKDLRGNACDNYAEQKLKLTAVKKKNELVGFSCHDALAKVLEKYC